MGTTCVEFLDENTLLSGCYDDRIRKFDLRHLAVPVSEFKSIGGIWRMKPHSGKLYVAACYGGCQVLRLDTFDLVEEYKGHESMVYGIGALGDSNVVSCSFYDKSIRFWNLS
jgi:WD40 repeat protein